MLKRVKTWHHKNQKGSVLLTVVIMIMVLFTLTTICLDVIHHSTRVSSRNVQKTQAKLTAEKVLTEFIEGYKKGKMADGKEENTAFADLQTLASTGTQAAPVVLTVSMQNKAGATQTDFDQVFGKTELHLYKSATGFVVESICTYSTQTQTASVVFEGSVESPYVPSHTFESQAGKLIAEDQLSNGIDGTMYIEKGPLPDTATEAEKLAKNQYKKLSRSGSHAHVYSEYSLRLDDDYSLGDCKNNCKDYMYDAAADSSGKKLYNWDQAPTINVDGYLTNANDGNNISTTVGKIDANKVSPLTASGATWDSSNLGNYDGFVRVNKKLLLTKASSFTFGDTLYGSTTEGGNPKNIIDIYTHGMVIGNIFYGKVEEGGTLVHDFASEVDNGIKDVFPGSTDLWTPQPNECTIINGNVYVYKGDSEITEDGSVTISSLNSLVANGDIFIEGNVYFVVADASKNSAGIPKFKTDSGKKKLDGENQCIFGKNVHIKGNIYIGTPFSTDSNNYCKLSSVTWSKFHLEGETLKQDYGTVTLSQAKNFLKVQAGGKIDNNIDTSILRNQFPDKGLDPQSGKVNNQKLAKLYEDASANDIFEMSVTGDGITKDPTLVAASQKISSKYADAMTREFDVENGTRNVTSTTSEADYYVYDATSKKYVKKHDKVVKKLACSAGEEVYYEINASIKLKERVVTQEQAPFDNIKLIGYVINLSDQDIVVALPIGCSSCRFRVNRSNIPKDSSGKELYNPFVYFMYYDPLQVNRSDGKADGCLYYTLGESSTVPLTTTDAKTTYTVRPQGVSDFVNGTSKGYIIMGSQNSPNGGTLVGDLTAVYTGSTSIPDNFKHDGFDNKGGDSDIMYLVPNDVGFGFSHAKVSDFNTWSGNGNKMWNAQGLVYALNSTVKLGCFESGGTGIYGQVKGYKIDILGDNKANHYDCPMKNGSLLGYVGVKNSAVSVVKLQYFLY